MAGEVTTENTDVDLGIDENQVPAGQTPGFIQDVMNDPQKRLIAIVIAAALVIVIGVFIFTGQKNNENRGKLVPLVQEIDQSRAFEIVAKLKSVNIEAKVDPGERPGEYVVKVFENAVESSYLTLSRTNLLEDDDYGLFDQNDWAASDYDKRIKLSRAINGDLSRIISRMDGLRSAIVRVNVPEQQIFTELQSATTATVQVELENEGEELSKSQVKSIVNILRGYVPKLDQERISIVDTQGRNYNTFKEDDEADTSDFIDEIERINKLVEKRVTKYLDVVIGSDDYEVSVSVSLSREKVQQNQTIYTEGAVGSRQVGSEKLNTNNQAAIGPGTGSGKSYNSSNTSETLLPSFEQKSITYLPGRITDVTVALAVDKSIPAMISLKQLQESVAAIIGPQSRAGDVKITVVDLHSASGEAEVAPVSKPGVTQMVTQFFKGGTWSVISKILIVIAIIIGLLLVAIIALNFLSAAAGRNYDTEIDPNLGNDFDEVLNDDAEDFDDFGEGQALQQQEELLREMMNQQNFDEYSQANSEPVTDTSDEAGEETDDKEFEGLLTDFQSVASSKPDMLAKKIQVWLDEDN